MNDFLTIETTAKGTELLLEGFFGYWPIVKEEVMYSLEQVDPDEPLDVYVDSMGGDPDTAIAIRRMISAHRGRTTLYVQGDIMSAATLLPGAFDEVVTDPFSAWLIHNPSIEPGWVDDEEATAMAEWIRIKKEQMADMYVKDSGQEMETVLLWMKSTKVFSGTEAVELGFADRTQEFSEKRVEAPADDMRVAAAAYNIPAEDLNGRTSPRQTKTKANNTMSQPSWINKMKAALGLGDDKDEADAVLTIKELRSKADQKEKLQEDYDALVAKNKELEDKLSDIEAEQVTAEQEEEQQQAADKEAAIQAAIKSFRITASQKDEWLDDYSDKPVEKLKAALERIPEGACKPGGSDQPEKPKTRASVQAAGINDQVAKDLGIK